MTLVRLIPWHKLSTKQIAGLVMTGFTLVFNGLSVEVWCAS